MTTSGKTSGKTITLIDGAKLPLSATTSIIVTQPEIKQLDTLIIDRIIDSPLDRSLLEVGLLVIVEGDEYDSMGDWTYSDVYEHIRAYYYGNNKVTDKAP